MSLHTCPTPPKPPRYSTLLVLYSTLSTDLLFRISCRCISACQTTSSVFIEATDSTNLAPSTHNLHSYDMTLNKLFIARYLESS